MRAQVHPNLSSRAFVLATFKLGPGWSVVDLGDDAVVRDLQTYVGSHVRLHPEDLGELEVLGLGVDLRGRLVVLEDVRAAERAERAAIADQEESEARRRARKEAGRVEPELGEVRLPDGEGAPLATKADLEEIRDHLEDQGDDGDEKKSRRKKR